MPHVDRRDVLRALSAGVTVGATGCFGRSLDDPSDPSSTGTAKTNSTDEESNADRLVPDRDVGLGFGHAIALSGATALVGAPVDGSQSGERSGAAYVFRWRNGGWIQEARLATEDADSMSEFVRAVALSGDTAVVGAPGGEDSKGESSGSAHVFRRADGRWSRKTTLVADGSDANTGFGRAVSVSGDTALIGAPEETNQNGERAGSTYVFQRSDGGWSRHTMLLPEDGGELDRFGYSVSLVGETALVSAIGVAVIPGGVRAESSAYVFERADDRWTEAATLVPEEGTVRGFGRSVDLIADTALIGAFEPSDEAGRTSTTSAYLFTKDARDWSQRAKIDHDSEKRDDEFGRSVALSDGLALVGAPDTDEYIGVEGSAHLFERETDRWDKSTVFDATSKRDAEPSSDESTPDFFGRSVALGADTALIAGTRDEDGRKRGTVCGFRLPS